MGGSHIETPEQEAEVIRELGPQHVRVCSTCSHKFLSIQLKGYTCWNCWYELEMKTAANSFVPLSTELERRLEMKTSVDQTGGMVMCLRVPIGRPNEDGYTDRYAYFGEYPSEDIGLGLYLDEEDEGEYHQWPGEFICVGPCAWYHHPDLCREVAEWAAPIIVEFATRSID